MCFLRFCPAEPQLPLIVMPISTIHVTSLLFIKFAFLTNKFKVRNITCPQGGRGGLVIGSEMMYQVITKSPTLLFFEVS